jgi:hypothetical protein
LRLLGVQEICITLNLTVTAITAGLPFAMKSAKPFAALSAPRNGQGPRQVQATSNAHVPNRARGTAQQAKVDYPILHKGLSKPECAPRNDTTTGFTHT